MVRCLVGTQEYLQGQKLHNHCETKVFASSNLSQARELVVFVTSLVKAVTCNFSKEQNIRKLVKLAHVPKE